MLMSHWSAQGDSVVPTAKTDCFCEDIDTLTCALRIFVGHPVIRCRPCFSKCADPNDTGA